MKGKRLPQVGRVDISIIEESNPQLLAFASGELDYVNVPADLVANVLGPGNALKPEFADKGVTLHRVTQPALSYTYFNMEDPVIGGYTPDKIALRRAMIMGFNTEEMIKVWWQGQALVATQPIPPGCWATLRASWRARRTIPPRRRRCSTSSVTSTATRTAGATCRTASRSPW
jgi:ABC-type transport system substrate-binding protein